MPAAGENGTAIGSVFYILNSPDPLNNPRKYTHINPYVGISYSNADIDAVLKQAKLAFEFQLILRRFQPLGWMCSCWAMI